MSRQEFSRKTRKEGLVRCDGKCEGPCRQPLRKGHFQFHHITEANEGGDNSLGNMLVVCTPCHAPLTKVYTQDLRKAERVADKHSGAFLPSRNPLPCGRRSAFKKKMSGEIVMRESAR